MRVRMNSIDSYVEENGRRYIRHYLQDFGSTLGSGSTSAQQPRGGYEYLIESDKIGKGLVTFGLWQRDWMKAKYSDDAVARQHRGRRVRAGEVEDGISAPGIRRDGCRGRILGGEDCRALHRRDDSRDCRGRAAVESGSGRIFRRVIIRRRDKVVQWGSPRRTRSIGSRFEPAPSRS